MKKLNLKNPFNIHPQIDCFYFDGYKPCLPHKQYGIHCDGCKFYKKLVKNILIVKLQAAGEVIRSTPILHRLKKLYPDARIYWVTKYPDLVPEDIVYKVFNWDLSAVLFLMEQKFDLLLNLDKDIEACSLANIVCAKIKKGFTQKNGVILPFDKDAERKWLTGIFDDLMKVNSQNYIEEIYAICGFKWNKEKYILPGYTLPDVKMLSNKKIIGINTGVGKKWVTRKLSEGRLITLIHKLEKKYKVVLLGGIEEDIVNKKISSATNAVYYGIFPLRSFIGLVSMCDLIITPVTLALHIAIGLEKKIILLNNIFPSNEFYLYGLGEILEPKVACKYCYKNDFDNKCSSYNCMDKIADQDILNSINRLLS